jgi:hypothetical protein
MLFRKLNNPPRLFSKINYNTSIFSKQSQPQHMIRHQVHIQPTEQNKYKNHLEISK